MDFGMASVLDKHRSFYLRLFSGQTCLRILWMFTMVCWMASVAVAKDAAPPEKNKADGASLQDKKITMQWTLDPKTGTVVGSVVKPDNKKPAAQNTLEIEADKPEDYQKIVAESAYPPSAAPEKLTLEQLETIAKLAPKMNKVGMQVHPAMVPLFKNMVLHYTGGNYKNAPIRFRLHTPEPYQPGKKYPMVVWLHGAGECGNDNVNQLSHLHHIIPYLVGPKKRDFFLLLPQCPHDHVQWEAPEICATHILFGGGIECHLTDDPIALGDAPISFTLAMVDAVMKQFPIDANRVTVGGLSTGGDGTWRMLERRPELFAAAVPVVSWNAIHDKALREKPLLKKIPIWAIYSSDDHAIDFARSEFERLREAGCHVFKTEFGVCGHRAWTPAMLQGDVFGWLISRAKDGERFYAADRSPTDPEKIGIFADVTDGDLKRTPTKATPKIEVPAPPKQPPAAATPAPQAPSAADVLVWRPHGIPPFGPRERFEVAQMRIELIVCYIRIGNLRKALTLADRIENRTMLLRALLNDKTAQSNQEVLDYVDRELNRMEQRGDGLGAIPPGAMIPQMPMQPSSKPEKPLQPIPAGKKDPKDECGKEWAMSSSTSYGLFPNGWDQETNHVPAYVVNESGRQLRDRLEKAFDNNDLSAMKEFCDSFIRLDDIPLSSPWFDTSGGRLQGRIKYTLNEKAKPVVNLLREIAKVKAESKQEYVELAKKSLERIDAITHPKDKP
jgi:pimeloyl-ACP methyl ester carboxylesterase